MKTFDRAGSLIANDTSQETVLAFLYGTKPGRFLLRALVHPWVSKLGGAVLDSPISCVGIKPFVKKNKIDLKEYEEKKYRSYNDFFTRRIKEGARPITAEPQELIAPCDSRLSVYPITKDAVFTIKNRTYTMDSLLRDEKLAERFEGGQMLVFRLTVSDYHHYCYVDSGRKSRNRKIAGVLHTVNPMANDVYPIYTENSREYSLLKSDHFGTVLMMEVGALMVGKIVNEDERCKVKRGQEKGHFEFGGSTVILCFQKDAVTVDADILKNSAKNAETRVLLGEKIGKAGRTER
ncbi:MAG: phosphatidylserine decarboxylase [Lachnospiraceae bacterium]